MLTICYHEDGASFPDFNLLDRAKEIVEQHKRGECTHIEVSTGNIIEALRVMVSRKEISHEEVRILFKKHDIRLNENAEYARFPVGFMDHERNFLKEMLERRLGKIS